MRNCTYLDPQRPNRELCTECGATLEACACVELNLLAHERINSRVGKMLRLVALETKSQDHKTNKHLLVSVGTEFGRLLGQLADFERISRLDRDSANDLPPLTAQDIFRTLIAIAALTARLATEGDADFSFDPDAIFGE